MPSTNKIKFLISDILLYDKKLESGCIDLEKKTLEYEFIKNKIINKQKKIKNKKQTQKTIKNKNENIEEEEKISTVNEIESLNEKIEKIKSEKLKLLIGEEYFDTKIINDRLNLYKDKINKYMKEVEDDKKQNIIYKEFKKKSKEEQEKIKEELKKEKKTIKNSLYGSYYDKEIKKVKESVTDENNKKTIMTEKEFYLKIIGSHDKSNIMRRMNYKLLKEYENLKLKPTDVELQKNIFELENQLKLYEIKNNYKVLNTEQFNIIIDRYKTLIKKYNDEITFVINKIKEDEKLNDLKNEQIKKVKSKLNKDNTKKKLGNLLVSKHLKESNIYKNIIFYSDYFTLLEKEKEINILNLESVEEQKLKLLSFNETNQKLKFIIDYRKIIPDKTFNNDLDTKVKRFLNYIIIINLYNDVLPLINLSKPCIIPFQKKCFINDTDKENNKVTLINDEKNVSLVLNKINSAVFKNLWC